MLWDSGKRYIQQNMILIYVRVLLSSLTLSHAWCQDLSVENPHCTQEKVIFLSYSL